ncbi:MAG: hypothetical protein RBT67_07750 [Thauera sp.]|nr:hypothetical protein [Thauera sp.]
MILSTEHIAARVAASRLPALEASFAHLAEGAGRARIDLFDASATLLASLVLAEGVGGIDAETCRIVLAVPIEGQIVADGEPAIAKVFSAAGQLWAEGLTVSDMDGDGDIKLDDVSLKTGAFARITTTAVFQG